MKKRCVATVLVAIWEIFLRENNRNYTSYTLNHKESGFQQVGNLVTRNIYVFVFSKSRSTSKPCHVNPVLIIAPCLKYSILLTIIHPVGLLAVLLKDQGCSSSSSSSRIVCILKISLDDGLAKRAKLKHALHCFSIRKKHV